MQKHTITIGLVVIAVIALVVYGVVYTRNAPGKSAETGTQKTSMKDFPETNSTNPVVTLKTSAGDITLELYMDKTPKTAGNFLKLAKQGFYTGTKFHRVIDNFMIQGGDPFSKGEDKSLWGRGGPGYTIEDEFNPDLTNIRGTIAMANIGEPNSGGSQFFINQVDNTGLDFNKPPFTSKHPVFGHVLAGMDVVDAIAAAPTDSSDHPLTDVAIDDVVIVRDFATGTPATATSTDAFDDTENPQVQ